LVDVKHIIYDASSGSVEVKVEKVSDKDIEERRKALEVDETKSSVDLADLKRLVELAKKKGWI